MVAEFVIFDTDTLEIIQYFAVAPVGRLSSLIKAIVFGYD
jgi:hypothetical protein